LSRHFPDAIVAAGQPTAAERGSRRETAHLNAMTVAAGDGNDGLRAPAVRSRG
jgi:hypothetical protein